MVSIGDKSINSISLVPTIVDFTTGGNNGIALKVSSKAAFAQVCRISGSKGNLGEISMGYYGKDGKVADENSFVVYNTGDSGIPMRAIVFCG